MTILGLQHRGELIVMDRWGEGHREGTDCIDQGERLGGLGIDRN